MNNALDTVSKILISRHRAAHPRSRAVSIIKFARNGGGTKQKGCVLCGATGPTFCGRYRETLRSSEWARGHAANHVVAALAAADMTAGYSSIVESARVGE